MKPFEISLRTVVPTFCRGRDEATAELRAPAIKGQLRWWYRALRPDAVYGPADGPWAEGRVMGGTNAAGGQSPFLLRIVAAVDAAGVVSWDELERSVPRGSRSEVAGIRYLAFPFRPERREPKDHRAVRAGVGFKVVHTFPHPKRVTDEVARGLVAAWWLFAHLGGLGARARRGFGSLSIEGWSWPGRENVLGELPLPSEAKSHDAWQRNMTRGLEVLDGWRDGAEPPGERYPHPHLGVGTEIVFQSDPAWRRYEDALEHAGKTLALGRRQHNKRVSLDNVVVDGRVTVGLPLETGRRRTLQKWRPGSFYTHRIESDRHASSLHLHVAAFRGGFGLTWAGIAGPAPGLDGYRVREEHSRQALRGEVHDTLGSLVASLEGARWTAGGRS